MAQGLRSMSRDSKAAEDAMTETTLDGFTTNPIRNGQTQYIKSFPHIVKRRHHE